MVPMMALGRAEDPAKWAEGQAYVRVDEEAPQPAEGDQRREYLHVNPEYECRQVHREGREERDASSRADPWELRVCALAGC